MLCSIHMSGPSRAKGKLMVLIFCGRSNNKSINVCFDPVYLLTILHIFPSNSHFRNLLEKNVEELEQQVQSLRLNEATMTRTNAAVSQLAKQLKISLTNAQAECKKTREEVRDIRHYQETIPAVLIHIFVQASV